MHVFCRPGLTPGGNLSGLDLSSMMGGMKDAGGHQSRFKWMMEGQSPAPSPPTTAFHKNGRCNRWISYIGNKHLPDPCEPSVWYLMHC